MKKLVVVLQFCATTTLFFTYIVCLHFWTKFKMAARAEVQKGSPVKFFEVSYYQNFFSPLQFIKVKIVGV